VKDAVLALGHVGIFAGLLEGCALDPARLESVRAHVESKNAAGVRDVLAGTDVPARVTESLARLTGLAGGVGVLDDAERAFAASPSAAQAVRELKAAVAALREAGLEERVAIDLGEVRGLDYYTGLVFRVYARGLGFEVGGGGRYDTLLARFGRPMPAVGFMFGLDRLALLLDRQGANVAGSRPSSAAVPAAAAVGRALREAREARARGTRIRFGNGHA
jgi:ATP phosphoribosyltransferase regulatory subunit